MTPTETLTDARVREALDDVLADGRFRVNPITEWLSQFWDKVRDALFGAGGALDGLGPVLAWTFWGVLLLVVVAIVFLIVRSIRLRRRRVGGKGEHVPNPVERRVAELLAQARLAEAEGDRLRALRLYFFALVVGLGQKGELRYRDAWTNRELLERGRPSSSLRTKLQPIVHDLDRKSFGGEPVLDEDVRRLEALCASWLGQVARTEASR